MLVTISITRYEDCKYKFCPSDAVTKIKYLILFYLQGWGRCYRDFYEKLKV